MKHIKHNFTNPIDQICESIHEDILNSKSIYEELDPTSKSFYRDWLRNRHPDFNPELFNIELKNEINKYIESMEGNIKPHVTVGSFFESVSTTDLFIILTQFDCSAMFVDCAFRKSKKIDIPLFLHNITEEDYVLAGHYLERYALKHQKRKHLQDCDSMDNFKVKFLNTLCLIRALTDKDAQIKYTDEYINKYKYLDSKYLLRRLNLGHDVLPIDYEKKLPPFDHMRQIKNNESLYAYLRYFTEDWEWYMFCGSDKPEIGYLFYAIVFSPYTGPSGEMGSVILEQLASEDPELDEKFTPITIEEILKRHSE